MPENGLHRYVTKRTLCNTSALDKRGIDTRSYWHDACAGPLPIGVVVIPGAKVVCSTPEPGMR